MIILSVFIKTAQDYKLNLWILWIRLWILKWDKMKFFWFLFHISDWLPEELSVLLHWITTFHVHFATLICFQWHKVLFEDSFLFKYCCRLRCFSKQDENLQKMSWHFQSFNYSISQFWQCDIMQWYTFGLGVRVMPIDALYF